MELSEHDKLKIMAATLKPIVELIEQRLNSRLDMLNTLAAQPLDNNLPESVKKMREEESAKIRAVVQEQRDLLATIKALYPIT